MPAAEGLPDNPGATAVRPGPASAGSRMREHDLIADWYATDRSRSIGVREALAAVAGLQPAARVLDLGCGNGLPITGALVDRGYRVVGLDSSRRMLERFRKNLPTAAVVRGDARACPFQPNV